MIMRNNIFHQDKMPKRFDNLTDHAMRNAMMWTYALITIMFNASVSHAQEFAALVTPPRVEVASDAGKTVRQVLEISHVGSQTATYRIYTADWTYGKDNTVSFFEPLQPNSCRPWVALERRELTLSPQSKRRFRFEIAIPPDAPAGECRFAIMIEGSDLKVTTESGVNFPLAGRLGVIVYANIGKGAPVIEVISAKTELVDGRATPTIDVRNTGNAHGRLAGILNAKDAVGKTFEITPNALPILAGETRKIALIFAADDKNAPAPRFPIDVKGNLEWADKKTPFAESFAALPDAARKSAAKPVGNEAHIAPAAPAAPAVPPTAPPTAPSAPKIEADPKATK